MRAILFDVEPGEAEAWIQAHVAPAGPLELVHERAWANVTRVPVRGGAVWFKECKGVQRFEPRLTAALHRRWPDRIAEVLGHDAERAWLLLADAGTPIGAFGNAPEAWAAALPLYAELQRGETAHVGEHLDGGVTDRRLERLPKLYEDMLEHELPVDETELERLRAFAPAYARLCAELAGCGIVETIQHDDLHFGNVYARDGRIAILDWGDASIAHPFFSLVVTFRFLEEFNRLLPGDPVYERHRDAYLEPWGAGRAETFDVALRVGAFAHVFGWFRVHDHLPDEQRKAFRIAFAGILRRALRVVP